jgi:hypothetical protein
MRLKKQPRTFIVGIACCGRRNDKLARACCNKCALKYECAALALFIGSVRCFFEWNACLYEYARFLGGNCKLRVISHLVMQFTYDKKLVESCNLKY